MEIPILETDRLILRPLTVDDAEAVFVWVCDERVTKYMPYPTYTSIIDVRKWLTTLQSENRTNNFGFVFKENNLLIGSGNEVFGARDFSSNHAVDNPASDRVMEKCGLIFHHYGEYSKFDGSKTFKAKFYQVHF